MNTKEKKGGLFAIHMPYMFYVEHPVIEEELGDDFMINYVSDSDVVKTKVKPVSGKTQTPISTTAKKVKTKTNVHQKPSVAKSIKTPITQKPKLNTKRRKAIPKSDDSLNPSISIAKEKVVGRKTISRRKSVGNSVPKKKVVPVRLDVKKVTNVSSKKTSVAKAVVPKKIKTSSKSVISKKTTAAKIPKKKALSAKPIQKSTNKSDIPDSFTAWLKNKKHASPTLAEKAKTSSIVNKKIASEPLAALLIEQGEIKKGIAMYKKLSLTFPKKSDYFKSIIDKIKA